MFFPGKRAFVASIGFLALGSATLFGYALSGNGWPSGSTIVMQLELGATNVHLQDGLGTWNHSAADALALWNQHLVGVQLSWIENSTAPNGSNNGTNNVFFSDTVYGDSFGGDTLAITVGWNNSNSHSIRETDVIFNRAVRFNSYRGPVQSHGSAQVFDLHRVALHEFGHALGLSHPSGAFGGVEAIMNSVIGDLDHLTADDIAGAQAIYGLEDLDLITGNNFTYQLTAANHPTRYMAVGLPPGLVLNSTTGAITGIPTISGSYPVTVTASAVGRTHVHVYHFKVASYLQVGQLLKTLDLEAYRLAADPVRPRIYASLPNAGSVGVLDSVSMTLIKQIDVGGQPQGIAVSADQSKLWVAKSTTFGPWVSVIDLNSLQLLPGLSASPNGFFVAEGLHGRLYLSSQFGTLAITQIDTATGATTSFGSFEFPQMLAISPDRKTLYAADGGPSPRGFVSYDISTATPSQKGASPPGVNGYYYNGSDLKISHDGRFLCYVNGGDGGTAKVPTADVSRVEGVFNSDPYPTSIAFSNDDLIAYQDVEFHNRVDIFDTRSFRRLGTINLGNPGIGNYYNARDLIVDQSGSELFVATDVYPAVIRVYTTGRRDLGPAPPAVGPKSLANVSTRAITSNGDDVMIGGFIITGVAPKKVVVRAIGPTLPLSGRLTDPTIELYNRAGTRILTNDNWNSHRDDVLNSRLAPKNEHEAAIVATLRPDSYTAIVRGADNGLGIALVEVYDISGVTASKLANISTRAKVGVGDNVMIGGFIISGNQPTKVIVRAIGPSLASAGVQGALQDPVLELHGRDGSLIFQNDNWRTNQQADIIATRIPPTDNRESAIVATLQPGNYTAIVRGKNNMTGVALVEVYNLETN